MMELLVIVVSWLVLAIAFCFFWGLFSQIAENSRTEDESGEGVRRG